MAPPKIHSFCEGWWAQIDGDLKLPGLATARNSRAAKKSSRRHRHRSADGHGHRTAEGSEKQSGQPADAVIVPRQKKPAKLTAAHEVAGKLATLDHDEWLPPMDSHPPLDARATVSGATGFRKTKSVHSPDTKFRRTDQWRQPQEQPPPVEANMPLPVVVVAPISVTISTDAGTEKVMARTWMAMDSTTTLEAALNCLSADAGGGTIVEGFHRLQRVPEDRLHASSAEANFQRCSQGTSLPGLRHAALILKLLQNRERQVGGVVPMGPALPPPSTSAEVSERARRMESIVAFRATTASMRTSSGAMHPTPRTPRLPSLSAQTSASPSQPFLRQSMMQKGLSALEEFTRFAEHKFGNTVRAWFAIDPEGKMTIGEKQFGRACDEIGFRGNVVALWRYLDSDQSGHITILELDAPAAITLAEFKHVIQEKFQGSALTAFCHMDDNRSDRLFKDEFVRSMRQLGFKSSSAAKLFSMFDRQRLGSITSKDVAFLDRWNPPPYLFSKPDTAGLDNFKTALRSIFTSLLRAWRQLLDRDATMRVSWDEFCDTCRYLQKKSSLQGLPKTEAQRAGIWRALDEDCGGWIALREFDQDAFECISTFKNWAMRNHGAVCTGFQALCFQNKLTMADLMGIENLNAQLCLQGLNVNNNATTQHSFDDKGKKTSWDVPFLIEKDVRFLDKWDLEWEEQESRAKHAETSEAREGKQVQPSPVAMSTRSSFRAGC
jgi:hypothetical protein